jgi:hypothetical protein
MASRIDALTQAAGIKPGRCPSRRLVHRKLATDAGGSGRGAADDAGNLGEGIAEDVVQDKRDALGGVIDSSTTRNAMETDSSRVRRSAGSAGALGRLLIHSAGSGSGSGIHWPT